MLNVISSTNMRHLDIVLARLEAKVGQKFIAHYADRSSAQVVVTSTTEGTVTFSDGATVYRSTGLLTNNMYTRTYYTPEGL